MASIEMEVNENSNTSKGFDDNSSDDDPFASAQNDKEMDLDEMEFAEIELPSSVMSRKDSANSQINLKIGIMHGVKNKSQNAQVVQRSRKDNENSQINMNREIKMIRTTIISIFNNSVQARGDNIGFKFIIIYIIIVNITFNNKQFSYKIQRQHLKSDIFLDK